MYARLEMTYSKSQKQHLEGQETILPEVKLNIVFLTDYSNGASGVQFVPHKNTLLELLSHGIQK